MALLAQRLNEEMLSRTSFHPNHLNLHVRGEYEQAVEEFQKGQLLSGIPPKEVSEDKADSLKLLRTGGPIALLRKILEKTLKDHEQGKAGALDVAGAYAGAGNKDKALEWLRKAYEEKYDITLVGVEPEFKNLHGDSRFSALLKHIGLPE